MGNNFVAAAAHSADTNMMSLVLKYATVDQVNAVNNKNYSVLDIAASHNTPAVVRLLRGANAEITSTIFIKSVTHTKATTVLNVMLPLLLEAGADIDARGNKGDTALHVAAFYGRTDVVDTLISLKADVNSLNDRGLTPLVTAVSRRYTTTAQPLLDAGATVPKSPGVMSEFNRLVCLGESYPVDILLNAKADVNGKDSKGFTPLRSCLMARNFHSHMLEKLVAAGADTVTYRELLLEVCIKHKVDPAVIGIVVGKEKADSKAGKKESSAEVAPEEATTA
jgi:ankyrin repeat protein